MQAKKGTAASVGEDSPDESNVKEYAQRLRSRIVESLVAYRLGVSLAPRLSQSDCNVSHAEVETRVRRQETGESAFRCPEKSIGMPKAKACIHTYSRF